MIKGKVVEVNDNGIITTYFYRGNKLISKQGDDYRNR